jgi:molybdopterin molybdotransferase
MGKEAYIAKAQLFPLKESCQKKEGLTQFMKALVEDGEVKVLTGQESFKMNTFAQSDCLVELEEEKTFFEKGDLVKVHFLS